MSTKLAQLREKMQQHELACYVCFHMDAHNSEYIAECDERIEFISGFSGSNGIVVVTADQALMWTDGRYYLQAGKQLQEGWVMMKMEADQPTWFGWIKDNLKEGNKVGLDFTQYPAYMLDVRFKDIKTKGITLISTPNLVDEVWGKDRPARPANKIFHLETKYTGLSTAEKLQKIFEKLGPTSIDCMLVTSLDEIAWVLNMRGTDIAYNPVFFSYAILYPDH